MEISQLPQAVHFCAQLSFAVQLKCCIAFFGSPAGLRSCFPPSLLPGDASTTACANGLSTGINELTQAKNSWNKGKKRKKIKRCISAS